MKAATAPRVEHEVPLIARTAFGLCKTCNNAEVCVYRKRRGFDAVYCEMFDGLAPNGHERAAREAVVAVTGEGEKTGRGAALKGLCVNCAHRDDCSLPRPEGGVWHCEEYA
jgi:hypothetical protein